jgi:hypothetical protein
VDENMNHRLGAEKKGQQLKRAAPKNRSFQQNATE